MTVRKKRFLDRMEVGPEDLSDMEDGLQETTDYIVGDAITHDRRFVGFVITKESGSSIKISSGRLYSEDKLYVSAADVTMNVTDKLPVANRRLLAIYVYGDEQPTTPEERFFVTDYSTNPPTGISQMTPINVERLVMIGSQPSAPSVDPQMPALPDGVCLVGTVTLTPTGILEGSITRETGNLLPQLQDHHRRLGDVDIWRMQIGGRVDALTSDQAALYARTVGKADATALNGVMVNLGKINRILKIAPGNAPYVTDLMFDSTYIDQTRSAVDTNYRISPFGGAEFPYAAQAVAPLALFNPYETSVFRSGGDLVLPQFDPVIAVEIPGKSGSIALNTISITTTAMKLMTGLKTETRYGTSG